MKFSAPLFLAIAALPTATAFAPSNGKRFDTGLNQWAKEVKADTVPQNIISPDPRGVIEFRGFESKRRGSITAPPKTQIAPPPVQQAPAPVPEPFAVVADAPAAPVLPVAPVAPVAPIPEQMVEEIAVPYYRTGISEDDVTEDDAMAVQLATERMSRLCPNFHPDLFGLVFWIQNGDAEEVTAAMQQLRTILGNEQPGEQNTEALYRSGAHIDLVRSLEFHNDEEEIQQAGMEILQKLTSKVRAMKLGFEGVADLQKSLASVGAGDHAFEAIVDFPENVPLSLYGLSLVDNLVDSYSFDEIVQMGLLDKTMAIIEEYEEDDSLTFIASDILYMASKAPGADLAMFEELHSVTILANIMEYFSGKDQKMHDKAGQALASILAIGA